MEEPENKLDTINIVTDINELIVQTEVTQYFKNDKKSPIELQMTIPKLSNNNLTRFEMTLGNKKVISKLVENNKAKEKYTDAIATGNYGFVSYSSKEETTICLGNIPPNEEITLKSYYFGHIISKDYSYQASFPVIFPGFILGDPKNENVPENYEYKKQIVKGKIYINTFSKLTRLVVKGSKNFGKIEKKFGKNYKSAEIEIYKDNFSEKDIPGIILFRTEEINKDKLFIQSDPNKEKNYYILQKTLEVPKFNLNIKETIDEDENLNYTALLDKKEEEKNKDNACYIFLLDQSGSMSGRRIDLCNKALLLFLQSLNEGCFFQLIGFGSRFEYYNQEPLEYNKENVSKLMDLIKNLGANKGGTELFSPLNDIFNNNIYEKYNMVKHIILLTDGEIERKEDTLNLIGSHSDKFFFHSIGIMDCDKDLIERSALLGNGYSYFIDNLDNLNKVIISVLEKTQSQMSIECSIEPNNDNIIQDNTKKFIRLNDFFRHGVVLDNTIEDFKFKIKNDKNEEEISIKNIEIKNLPNGEELGKIIIDDYLINNKSLDFRTKIKLSKGYNILCSETAFYAEIQNEVPIKEKMITIKNKDKQAVNNNIIENIEPEAESELRNMGYENKNNDFNINDNEIKENNEQENKNGFFSWISSLFSCKKEKNKIINKKTFEYHEKKREVSLDNIKLERCSPKAKCCCCCCDFEPLEIHTKSIKKNYNCDLRIKEHCAKESFNKNIFKCCDEESFNSFDKEDNEVFNKIDKESNKKILNFDEIILSQDIIEGNWKKDENVEILMEEENDLFEKIKKFSENKGINDENGIITLFILYYIFKKKPEKVEELKFVIDKTKKYIKKIYNLEYDYIAKELDSN